VSEPTDRPSRAESVRARTDGRGQASAGVLGALDAAPGSVESVAHPHSACEQALAFLRRLGSVERRASPQEAAGPVLLGSGKFLRSRSGPRDQRYVRSSSVEQPTLAAHRCADLECFSRRRSSSPGLVPVADPDVVRGRFTASLARRPLRVPGAAASSWPRRTGGSGAAVTTSSRRDPGYPTVMGDD
jgi:hypothetical protein